MKRATEYTFWLKEPTNGGERAIGRAGESVLEPTGEKAVKRVGERVRD